MNSASQSTKGFNVIFIHSSLDDAGLTAPQFRVLAHISRRAGDSVSWASNATMASHCNLSEATVVEALKELERRRILKRNTRPGKTTEWEVNPPLDWDLDHVPRDGNGRPPATPPQQYPPQTMGGHPPQTIPPHPPQTRGDEGYPMKGIPGRESQPAASKSPKRELTDGWCAKWQAHHGMPYKFEGAKDGRAADRLLALALTPADILAIAEQAWRHPDWFNCKQAATLAGFECRFNDIRLELKNPPGQKRPQSNIQPLTAPRVVNGNY